MNLINNLKKLFIRPFNRLPLKGIGVEIGVAEAVNARSMLGRHPEIDFLHLVDPYAEYHQEPDRAKSERIAHKRMEIFKSKVKFHKCSADKVNLPKLDFAYIDGDHSYEAVKRDIEVTFPLMKSGG